MKNKHLGVILVIISLLVLTTLIVYNLQIKSLIDDLMASSGGSCIIEGECVHEKSLFPLYLGSIVFAFLLSLGIYLIFFEKKPMQEEKKKIEIPKDLDEEEKKIIEILNSKEGSAYQSDLIKETGFSKVKITRILDKLEHRKLIDRKRRGMTNLVILK